MGTKKGPYCSGADDNKMKMVQPIAVSVNQGKSLADELDWTPEPSKRNPHDGLTAKIPKK